MRPLTGATSNSGRKGRFDFSDGQLSCQTEGVEAFVRASSWAAALQPDSMSRLLAATTVCKLAPGEVLCHQGEKPLHWYGLMKGLLRQDVFTHDGERVSLAIGRKGLWIGEAALVMGEPRRYEMSALREAVVVSIGAQAFAHTLCDDPEFNRAMMLTISHRMHYYMELYVIQHSSVPEQRVACVLRSMVGEMPQEAHLHLTITQDEVAQLAGISRQRTHRALHEMQQRGIIEIAYGAITILDFEELKLF
ncbi:MAG: Crp/Fnr family transcriptional regulator [Burkholderiaceae bacterium]|nr:Crp/Fnr family transcriptional regulator [Burkholderiaceae bacterium]